MDKVVTVMRKRFLNIESLSMKDSLKCFKVEIFYKKGKAHQFSINRDSFSEIIFILLFLYFFKVYSFF